MKNAKATNLRMLTKLSSSLEQFDAKYTVHFLCPTCLTLIPVDALNKISVAHIVPLSAGGNLTTLLCKRCNSTFGARQDKWFGEYLYLRGTNKSAFHARHQDGRFEVAGKEVGGEYDVTADGTIELRIHRSSTNPKALDALMRKIVGGRVGSVTIPVPLMAHRHLLSVGALTAAYLLWFRELGYSWALQRHLDPIRKFMRNPEGESFPTNFAVRTPKRFFDEPWVGMGRLNSELAVIAAVGDHIVFFPTADRQDYYANLPADFKGLLMHDVRGLGFYRNHGFEGPIGVIYHDRAIIAPDALRARHFNGPFLFFPPDYGVPRMMYPISKAAFDRRRTLPNALHVKVNGVLR